MRAPGIAAVGLDRPRRRPAGWWLLADCLAHRLERGHLGIGLIRGTDADPARQVLIAGMGYFAHVLTTDRTHTLLDRWRDIVRRALTARLMLGDDRLGPPIWPFVGMKGDVGLKLAVKSERDAWRARVVAGATTYGLPLLVEPAPPLLDYRHG